MIQKAHRVFFLLLVLFLPSQLGFHFWPSWAYVLGRRVDYLSPTLYFTDVLLLATIGFWFISEYRRLRPPLATVQGMALFTLTGRKLTSILLGLSFILFNITLAISPFAALYGWIKVLEFSFLGLYIVKTRPSWKIITILLSIGAFFSVCLGIAQIFHQGSIGTFFWFLGERTFTINTPDIAKATLCMPNSFSCVDMLRPYATFPHPNVLAGFLGVTILFIIARKKDFPRLALWKILALCGIGLVLTFSRTAWLALGVTVAFLYWKRKLPILIGTIVLFSLIFLYTPFSTLMTSESVAVRSQLTQAAVKILRHYPLWGVGNNNFLIALPLSPSGDSFLQQRSIYFLQPVHNIYLLFLTEFGLVGTILLGSIFYKYTRKFIHTPLLPLSPLIFLLLIGFLDHYPLTLQQGQLLLTLAFSFSLTADG